MPSNKDTAETTSYDENTQRKITEQLFNKKGTTFKDESDTNGNNDVVDEAMFQLKDRISDDMKQNKELKRWFFWISCGILSLITIALVNMLDTMFKYKLPDNSTSFALQVVTVVSSFITAFMVLPRIIATHLFGTEMQNTFIKLAKHHKNINSNKKLKKNKDTTKT